MSAVRPPEIGQAFYGSFSGYHDYRVLAASSDLEEGEKSEIQELSNLGGTALTADSPGSIWAAYDLDRRSGRKAFSRTVFLRQGTRGNDYLAHVLVLGPDALHLLRGDLFLLADLNLFSDKKPSGQELLAKLALDPEGIEALSHRHLGAGRDQSLSRSDLTGVLRALARGLLALPEEDTRKAEALCRSVLAVLPPEDRERLSFCSRFSLPRSAPFRLALYHPDDKSLAENHLRGFSAGSELPDAGPGDDPIEAWMDGIPRGIEPAYRLSLLHDSEAAAPRAAAFREGKLDYPGVLEMVEDEHNQTLASVRDKLARAAVEEVVRRINIVLNQGGVEKPLVFLAEACARLRERDPRAETVDTFLNLLAGQRAAPLQKITTGIVLALLVPTPPWLGRIYRTGGADALLRGREEAAQWILDLYGANSTAAAELLGAWLIRWRGAEGAGLLAEMAEILESIALREPTEASFDVLSVCREALGRAAPSASAAGGAERIAWFRDLLDKVEYPARDAARLVVQESLLAFLSSKQASKLVPVLVANHAEKVLGWLKGAAAPEVLLLPLLRACRNGLLPKEMGGLGWAVQAQPVRWELAAEAAAQAAVLAGTRPSPELYRDLAWLLWAASRLLFKHNAVPGPEVRDRFETALNTLLSACPDGIMDLVVWIVYRWQRFRGELLLRISPERLRRVRQRAWEDARRGSPSNEAFSLFLVRIAHLDKILPWVEAKEGLK